MYMTYQRITLENRNITLRNTTAGFTVRLATDVELLVGCNERLVLDGRARADSNHGDRGVWRCCVGVGNRHGAVDAGYGAIGGWCGAVDGKRRVHGTTDVRVGCWGGGGREGEAQSDEGELHGSRIGCRVRFSVGMYVLGMYVQRNQRNGRYVYG